MRSWAPKWTFVLPFLGRKVQPLRRRDNSYPWLKMPYENPDISKSVQRFQLAIQSAKVRLDLAISPGLWLLPSKMVVNTESVVGYNNKLKKATTFMRIGVNSDLNIPVRRSAPKHNLGSRAVKLPHSGVETQNSVAGATADAEPGKLEKAKHRTKETQVVKSEKKRKKRQRQRIR